MRSVNQYLNTSDSFYLFPNRKGRPFKGTGIDRSDNGIWSESSGPKSDRAPPQSIWAPTASDKNVRARRLNAWGERSNFGSQETHAGATPGGSDGGRGVIDARSREETGDPRVER
jgi:hypothetical protein